MTPLLNKFRELPDYRKCKQLKFNVGEIMFMSLLSSEFQNWADKFQKRLY